MKNIVLFSSSVLACLFGTMAFIVNLVHALICGLGKALLKLVKVYMVVLLPVSMIMLAVLQFEDMFYEKGALITFGTLIGGGILAVFVFLFFMSILISLFGFIPVMLATPLVFLVGIIESIADHFEDKALGYMDKALGKMGIERGN
ncbi:hypothetical protein SAMN02910384_02166 [Pseudobutyrivibrio sp. ACV-2]|uniref:hypothetical protein n=1 Tax=Pseudobutyrivibrio sp. ACV-2 TaxID=1520801 RepID=UPI00089AE9DE|nr:hypothetical protein [Pseudobutyrivibrio sp. ACV-2]SEA72334.1 hypothetical protein SAMN02910384_02166 [Pseudobutyrivibrio sp. ACV-2]